MASRSRGRGQISELVHLAPIKKGKIAPAECASEMRYADRLRTVLEVFNAREDQGTPGVIRVFRGLHNATWSLIDGDTRLLLTVIFDGDLHGYLRGLARDVPATLALVWGNCEGWENPGSDPQKLIDFIERHQVRASNFYAHYPQLTVPDVEALMQLKAAATRLGPDATIRELQAQVQKDSAPISRATRIERLFEAFGERERMQEAFWGMFGPLFEAELLERVHAETFGGASAPAVRFEEPARAQAVQSMVVAHTHERHATRMLFLNFPSASCARALLSVLSDQVHFGRHAEAAPQHLSIGFTHAGLRDLGVSPALLHDFPEAFVQGMEDRAASLGDVPGTLGQASRNAWTYANPQRLDRPVHAVLFVHAAVEPGSALSDVLLGAGRAAQAYAADDYALQSTAGDRAGAAAQLRAALHERLDDAQAALGCSAVACTQQSVLVLGHQDLHQPLAQSDPQQKPYAVEYFGFRDGVSQPRLPGEPYSDYAEGEPSWLQERASFDSVLCRDKQGLLKDATFLVARQLRQEPEAFWCAMREQAQPLHVSARELAEQIVGRRMDGRRLDSKSKTFHPVQDRHAFDPDRAQPSCPFHSHVRRANPRTETDLAHNPRLLRRGMAYANARSSGEARGLMFMAFNADIEEQFELMQKHWIQGGNQVGLAGDERDVISGQARPRSAFGADVPARFHADLPDRTGAPSPHAQDVQFHKPFVSLEWGIYLYFPAREAFFWLSHNRSEET